MTAVPVPAAGERPVGREAELALLARAVEGLVGGRGSIVEIAGEPGIGKTRLALTLMELAARRGVPVVRAHAIRGNSVPFQVLRDAWETRRGPGAEPFDAGRDRIAEWATGCVLVLDDLHWCDRDSAAVLARLVRSVVPGPLLLALVHRPGQTAPELREALEDGVRTGTVTRLEPGPLDRESVAALLAGWGVPTGSSSDAWTRGEGGASGGLPLLDSSTPLGADASTPFAASASRGLSSVVSADLSVDPSASVSPRRSTDLSPDPSAHRPPHPSAGLPPAPANGPVPAPASSPVPGPVGAPAPAAVSRPPPAPVDGPLPTFVAGPAPAPVDAPPPIPAGEPSPVRKPAPAPVREP